MSAASAWEIATKFRLGKLEAARMLVQDIGGWLRRAGLTDLPISVAHAQKAGAWALDHRDPFDRMLAAQSALEHVPLVSNDRELRDFGIEILW